MYMKFLSMGEVLILVAALSLGWFLVGVLAGQAMSFTLLGRRSRKPGGARVGEPMEIYVGNLPYSIKERELERAFGRYGRVDSVRIIKNKFNGKSKGFGFVEMSDHGEASEAVRALNGKDFGGRRIVVNEAKSEPRS